MPLLYALFFLCLIATWWSYSGYVLFISWLARGRRQAASGPLPSITIVVPCFNEEKLIQDKLENLMQLTYPGDKLKVIVADGCSTDRTCQIVESSIRNVPYIELVQTNKRGKIPQINHVLPLVKSDIVVNTDVDGLLEANALLSLAREFQRRGPRLGVVGALVFPQDCSPEDVQFWKTQNRLRLLESRVNASSTVVAVCYAFRNGIVEQFPEDVVADDVYLCFQAHLKGYGTVYTADAVAYEKRASRSSAEFIRHKSRKANANLRELFRFVGKVGAMDSLWRVAYLTKFLQTVATPLLLLAFLGALVALPLLGQFYVPLFSLAFLLASTTLSNRVLSRIKLATETGKDDYFMALKTMVLIEIVLLRALLTYPFYRQTSSYKRIR